MATSEKTISTLISSQLPGFIRADHPTFIKFLEKYYEWLEDETKGNTVYHIMNSDKYRDVDQTLDPFIRILKSELLPYFPEKTELDLVKILKGAREFYSKKGSEESLKWLFRVLFDQEIEVYYPKQQILVASDGKWKLPKAFNLTLTGNNLNVDPNLLEKRTGTGSESTATCVVESANKTIDRNFGNEILEIYVSNVTKEFINGEQLVIQYVDTNGVTQTFSEKIIGSISNIRLDTNIRTDPQQKKRGLLYNVGDPVVVFGGLDTTSEATDAVAYVGNVSSGSIEGVIPTFPGYGYRLYSNTIAVVYRAPEDDPGANSRTDIRISGLNEISLTTNSQASFKETIEVDKMPILYLANEVIGSGDRGTSTDSLTIDETSQSFTTQTGLAFVAGERVNIIYATNRNNYMIGDVVSYNSGTGAMVVSVDVIVGSGTYSSWVVESDYTAFTQNNRNIIITLTESSSSSKYQNNELIYANGANYSTAYFKAKIATPNNAIGFGAGGAACTAPVVLYDVKLSNATGEIAFTKAHLEMTLQDLSSGGVICANTNKAFTYDDQSDTHTDINEVVARTNASSFIYQGLATELIDTGGIALYNVLEGGFGFRATPNIQITSYYDTFLSEAQAVGDSNFLANTLYQQYRQPIGAYGKIAHVYIDNPGTGYANGDTIVINGGTGYGFVGNVTVNSIGAITRTNIINRGEGYFHSKNVEVTTVSGANAVLTAYGFGEGVENSIDTGAIGRIRDIRVVSRGFDYISTPVVSLKVVDMMISAPTSGSLTEGDIVYQGPSLSAAIFQGTVKSYNLSTGKLRLFNYSGNSFSNFNFSLPFTKNGTDSTFSIDTTKKVPAPDQYPEDIKVEGLPNPYFYGNGKARALAEFFNGLIQYPGFYVNTDGFLSADKKTQDSKTYHNYSYIIESSKSIEEYEETVKDILHPAGTSMLSRFVANNQLTENISTNNIIYTVQVYQQVSNIQVSDSTSNVVTGNGTLWTAANNLIEVGDMILLQDSLHPLRNQAKIVSVVTSDTEIETVSDFTYVGEGKIDSNVNFQIKTGTVIINPEVSGNVEINSPITALGTVTRSSNVVTTGGGADFTSELLVGDIITINNQTRAVTIIANADYLEVNSVFRFSGTGETIYLSSNTVTGTSTLFLTELSAGDVITVNNEIKIIENIIDDATLNVNSVFVNYATEASLYLANTEVLGSGTNFDPEIAAGDFIRVNNQVKQVVTRTSDTLLTVNSAFKYHGTANAIERLENTQYRITSNVNPVVYYIDDNDVVKINIASANLFMAQTGTVEIVSSETGVIGTSTDFDNELAEGDIIMINNQVRKIVSVDAGQETLNVNSNFTTSNTGEILYKLATNVDAIVTVSGNVLSTNVAINANLSNLVYKVIPDYSTRDYTYRIITVTD